MFILRIFLLLALLIGGAYLAFHVPWKASTEVHGVVYTTDIGDAPFFKPPQNVELTAFEGRVSPYLDRKTVQIDVWMDKLGLFARFAGLVVGAFFIFGVAGYFIDRRPLGSDVAYSLALSGGFLASSILCLLLARLLDRDLTRWLPVFWAAGLFMALAATAVARRKTPAANK